jgi:hypothetical protein
MTHEELHDKIKDHLVTFPERYNDVLEMQKEWKSMKRIAFVTLLGFAGGILSIGIWVGTIQSNLGHFDEELSKADNKHILYESRITSLEVNNSEIRSRLTSIEVTLQEIKAAIIKLQ